ncbi:MAG: phenylalanine--tRNA ligase subunit beta [Patescibacteria group bacterium]
MKISLNLIKEYTYLPDNKNDLYAIIDTFAIKSVDVDSIVEYPTFKDDILIGEVKEIYKHKNADRLYVTKVNIKSKEIQIVTGAPNVYKGMIVPLILEGGVINGQKIEKHDFRGEISYGMMCSEKELGLGENHSGILDLGAGPSEHMLLFKKHIGESLKDVIKDTIIDIDNKVISQRGDLFSHQGIAREFAAIENKPFNEKFIPDIKTNKNNKLKVSIEDKDFCYRYCAITIDNINIEESPFWMRERLKNLGIKPVNNIVDITNYVMVNLGQPLHAFDIAKISKNNNFEIYVRKAKQNEDITTLDSKKRLLKENNYVIATKNKSIGIAGVMGGKESEIDENTHSILLESAAFNPSLVRRSAKSVNIRSEAVLRYEKGISQLLTLRALNYAVELILQNTTGQISSSVTDIITRKLEGNSIIKLDISKIEKVLGMKIPVKDVSNILSSLNINNKQIKNFIITTIPNERFDIKEDVDLIEEIGRIYGYNNINIEESNMTIMPVKNNPIFYITNNITKIIAALGGYEIKTYSFINQGLMDKSLIKNDSIKILNPISPDFDLLRPSLIPSMIDIVSNNQRHRDSFILYEIANIYLKNHDIQPKEELHLITAYFSKDKEEPFFYIKGILDIVNSYLDLDNTFEYIGKAEKPFLKNKSSKIYIDGDCIGDIGDIGSIVKNNFGIYGNLAIFDINIDNLYNNKSKFISINNISKFPEIKEDLTILYKNKVTLKDILDKINDKNLKTKSIIDVYNGNKIKSDETSVTIRLVFENFEKTFLGNEIKDKINNIRNSLLKEFKDMLTFR